MQDQYHLPISSYLTTFYVHEWRYGFIHSRPDNCHVRVTASHSISFDRSSIMPLMLATCDTFFHTVFLEGV